MDTPDRADEPVESWEYRDHLCHVYSGDVSEGGETAWAGYTRTKLPDAEGPDDVDVDVLGELTYGVEEGWLGFETVTDSANPETMRAEVERLVDEVIELEASMDG